MNRIVGEYIVRSRNYIVTLVIILQKYLQGF